jgi:uncharacterized protein
LEQKCLAFVLTAEISTRNSKEQKMTRQILSIVLASSLLLSACSILPVPSPEPQASMVNPASAHCEQEGGKVVIRTAANGDQFGACVLPGGTECEEWEFFHGQCTRDTQSAALAEALPTVANMINSAPAAIKVTSVEAAVWGDQCLGLAGPDEACAEMITPGYIVKLDASGAELTFHIDMLGRDVRQAQP